MGIFDLGRNPFGMGGSAGNNPYYTWAGGLPNPRVSGPLDTTSDGKARLPGDIGGFWMDNGRFPWQKADVPFDPYEGMPEYPNYQGPLALEDKFQIHANAPDYEVLGNMRGRALSEGLSPWGKLAEQRQRLDESQQHEQLLAGGRAGAQGVQDQLAMTGGLTSGASERALLANEKQTGDRLQKLAHEGMGQRLSLGMEDEKQKLSLLQNLPSIQNQAYAPGINAQERNVENALNEGARKNAFNLGRYGEQMRAWSGGKQAQAIERSGKK